VNQIEQGAQEHETIGDMRAPFSQSPSWHLRLHSKFTDIASCLIAAALIVAGCVHAATPGSQPNATRVVHHGQEIEVDAAIDDGLRVVDELVRKGMTVSALWGVPGEPTMRVAVIERPAAEAAYGPQLVALDVRGDVRLLQESPRLYDDDFVHPTFFAFTDRTLLLADRGSEDAYGMLAWSIENGSVRDLGQLPIGLPEARDVFTRGAAATARVEVRAGQYVISIPGPVLLNPQGADERVLAKQGETVTFRESAGRFELVDR
jgi:hypothetical protein